MSQCPDCAPAFVDLNGQIAELRAQVEIASRELKRCEVYRSSADINADFLKELCGEYARCSLCSWVASDRAELLGKAGRECIRCGEKYCLECADVDRDVFKDDKKECCTRCRKRILCDCKGECLDCYNMKAGKRSLENDQVASSGTADEGGDAKRVATETKHVLDTPVL